MIEQRQFKKTFAIGFGKAAAGGVRLDVALMFVMNDQIAKAHQLDGGDPFVRAIKEMLHTAC